MMNESPVITPSRRWWDEIHLATAFLTRLPLPDMGIVPPGGLAAAMRCFPLVGMGLGLAAGALAASARGLGLPPLASGLLAVLILTLLTGALHEDGLADLADGLGARGDRDKRLEVMRDSHSGAFGVLALVFSVGLRAAALAALPGGWRMIGAAMAGAALSRAMIPAAMQIMAPARPEGLGASAGTPDASTAATAAGIGLVLAALGLGLGGALAATLGALAGGWLIVILARRSLGGYTGDVLGAVQQTAEIGILLAAAAVWS